MANSLADPGKLIFLSCYSHYLLLDPVKLCWFLSAGLVEAVKNSLITLSSHVRLTRPPVFVDTNLLHKSTHSCRPRTPACWEQVLCFKTQTPESGFTEGPAAWFFLGFPSPPLWNGTSLERLEHLKPYPHPKNTIRIFFFAVGLQSQGEG